MSYRFISTSITALALSTCLTSVSFAFDAQGYFNKWESKIEAMGTDVTIGSLEENGADGATLSDIVITFGKKDRFMKIDQLVVTGASEVGEDGFSFKTLSINAISIVGKDRSGGDVNFSIKSLTGTDFSIDSSENRKHPLWPLNLGSAELKGMSLAMEGNETLSFTLPSLSLTGLKATTGNGFTLGSLQSADVDGTYIGKSSNKGSFAIGASSASGVEYKGLTGFNADSLSFGKFELNGVVEKDKPVAVSFAGLDATNLFYPDIASTDGQIFSEKDMTIAAGSASLSLNNELVGGWESMIGNSSYDAAADSVNGKASLNNIFFDTTKIPDDRNNRQLKAQMAELGYDTITLTYGGDFSWNFGDGLFDTKSLLIDVKDVGTINMAMKISGYTREFLHRLFEISTKIQGQKDQQKIQAASMEMLGLYSQLSFVDAKLSLTNGSLANRLIEMQAKKTGQQPEQMATSLPFMAGAILPQVGLQNYAQAASEAIGNFLQLNGSATVKIAPDEPIPILEFMQIQAAVKGKQMTPADVAKRLNLEITSK